MADCESREQLNVELSSKQGCEFVSMACAAAFQSGKCTYGNEDLMKRKNTYHNLIGTSLWPERYGINSSMAVMVGSIHHH